MSADSTPHIHHQIRFDEDVARGIAYVMQANSNGEICESELDRVGAIKMYALHNALVRVVVGKIYERNAYGRTHSCRKFN